MKKFLLISVLFLGLILTAYMGFFWLLGSNSGNLYLLSWVSRLSPYKITATIEKPLLKGLEASSIKLDGANLKITLSGLTLAWRPQNLWAQQLYIEQLQLKTLAIDYHPEKDTATSRSNSPPAAFLPLLIDLEKIQIDNFNLSQQGRKILELSQISSRFHGDSRQLRLTELTLNGDLGALSAEISCDCAPRLRAQARLSSRGLDLGRFHNKLTSNFNLDVSLELERIDGGWALGWETGIEEKSTLHGRALSGVLAGRWQNDELYLDRCNLQGDGLQLTGKGRFQPASLSGQAELDWENFSLALLPRLKKDLQLEGLLAGKLRLAGKGREQLKLDFLASGDPQIRFAGKEISLPASRLEASWNQQGLQIEADLRPTAGGHLQLTAGSREPGRLAWPTQAEFTLNWQDFPLQAYSTWLALPTETTISGNWQGQIQGQWRNRAATFALTGKSRFEQAELVWKRPEGELRTDIDQLETMIDWRQGKGRLELSSRLGASGQLGGFLEIAVPATLPLPALGPQPLRGRLSFSLNELGLASLLFPEMLEEVHGRLAGETTLAGKLDAPDIGGHFTLSQAGGLLPATGVKIEDLTLKGELQEDKVLIAGSYLSPGQSPDPGELKFEGGIDLAGWQPASWHFNLKGERVLVVDLPDLSLRSSPELQIDGNPEEIKVSGKIVIPQMRLSGVESQALTSSPDIVLVNQPAGEKAPPGPRLMIDVNIRLGDHVVIKTHGIDARLGGGLKVRGQAPAGLHGQGEIEIVQGRYAAYGLQLPISRGRLNFTGGPIENPLLDILAERVTGEIRAGVQVSGTAKEPLLRLTSSPPLPDADILSYLVLGRPLNEAGGQESALALAAGALLNRGESAALQEQIKSHLGLDVLRVEKGASLEDAMVTIGKYLTPDLYLSFRQSLFSSTNLATLRYRLGKNWELESQLGSTSGADLYYRLEFR